MWVSCSGKICRSDKLLNDRLGVGGSCGFICHQLTELHTFSKSLRFVSIFHQNWFADLRDIL